MNQQPERPPTRRAPLGEATRRVNNEQQSHTRTISKQSPIPHHDSLRKDGLLQIHYTSPISPLVEGDYYPLRNVQHAGSPSPNAATPRLSAIFKDSAGTESKRNSQISQASTNASDGNKVKALIGPWRLGKTLGKGATARVRLARHAYTGQEAAVKIVQKHSAHIAQAGSLAALDRADSRMPPPTDGLRRMPVGIEREVAIMKLIQHPNILKLYDIWENRHEIYLVLEYVGNGELFEHITQNYRLSEEEAMKYFRQMLSAVGYCHSFNICHRDLKPENILLTHDLEIKIADFGMAALQQNPEHKLTTSCGSPHYAAPELIGGNAYRGNKVDIWSMGIILYASLAGRLPFDVEGTDPNWLPALLTKIQKGSFEMSPFFTPAARNLIWRMLQNNPRERISLSQIWKHPLIRQYDYLDDLGAGIDMSPELKACGPPVKRRSDISKELLRHLRSLWHLLSEDELTDRLMSPEPNDQKRFYHLFVNYREAQLENYTPDLGHSASDYHYLKPPALTKTYSTRHFSQLKGNGHGRQISRFTVISNVAETEVSYDPFKASRPQHLDTIQVTEKAKVTIHRTRPSDEGVYLPKHRGESRTSFSVSGSDRGRSRKPIIHRGYVSRSSLASSTRSRSSAPYVRVNVGHKRGVSFSRMRHHSAGPQQNALVGMRKHHSSNTEVTDNDEFTLRPVMETPASTRYIRSKKAQPATLEPLLSVPEPDNFSELWTDDVRQLSSSLAQDCDDAFNRFSTASDSQLPSKTSTAISSLQPSHLTVPSSLGLDSQESKITGIDSRPLPLPPARTESVKAELLEAKKQAELRKKFGGDDSPGYLDRMVSHIDRLIQPMSPGDRRTISAPMPGRPLPSIYETGREEGSPSNESHFDNHKESQKRNDNKNGRVASAPEARDANRQRPKDRFTRLDTGARETIRVVQSSDSPVKVPAPLTIRKKSTQGGPSLPLPVVENAPAYYGTQYQSSQAPRPKHNGLAVEPDPRRADDDDQNDDLANESITGTIVVKKKSNWFKRSSKSGDDLQWRMSIGGGNYVPSQSSSNDARRHDADMPPPVMPKKKFSLGRLFKKRISRTDMTLAANFDSDDIASLEDSSAEGRRLSEGKRASNLSDNKARQIEPHRNWLAKLFNVKPATAFICFSVNKRRARQEIVNTLRTWKKYGLRDVQIEKERNIVFGRVCAKNFLDLKEVAFAAEIMTVIEHGKRSQLSIARFTQERGAASSFYKVVDTMETVLKCRNILVVDGGRRRMMVKTLRAAV